MMTGDPLAFVAPPPPRQTSNRLVSQVNWAILFIVCKVLKVTTQDKRAEKICVTIKKTIDTRDIQNTHKVVVITVIFFFFNVFYRFTRIPNQRVFLYSAIVCVCRFININIYMP